MIYISGILFYLFSRKKGKEKGRKKERKEKGENPPFLLFFPFLWTCLFHYHVPFMSLFAYFFLALYILPTFLHLILVIG
jgi:hypothetical protein